VEKNIMNKNRRFFLFARLSGIFLVLVSFAMGGWTAHARSLADSFLPGTWTKLAGNPVLNTGASSAWDDQWVFGPSVILDGTTYKMWYTSYSAASKTYKIGYATSPDGLVWTKQGSTPVLQPGAAGTWDANGVSYPMVIKDGSTYKMWYTGTDASKIGQVGYAISTNGTEWTKYASNPVLNVGASGSWDSGYVGMVSVVKVGTTYKLWYRGSSATGGAIGYATSPNGWAWSKYDPAITGGSGGWDTTPYHPEVIFDGMVYHMWYSGCNQAEDLCQEGYATSPDGAQWTRKGMVLPQGTAGTGDDGSADHASVLQVGSTLKMWYSGFDGASYRIGYASTTATILDHHIFLPLVTR
jgi:predicted GH43/DUF377 family glycosyl hydrolase